MARLLIVTVVVVLILGFVGSAYASYNGVGLVTSGTPNTGINSRGVLFVFPGGGPGSGK
ncbi:MAG: hypothetical protein ACFE0Q_18540 [Anaerolineae bacterium]